jgi:hypothetical protein
MAEPNVAQTIRRCRPNGSASREGSARRLCPAEVRSPD